MDSPFLELRSPYRDRRLQCANSKMKRVLRHRRIDKRPVILSPPNHKGEVRAPKSCARLLFSARLEIRTKDDLQGSARICKGNHSDTARTAAAHLFWKFLPHKDLSLRRHSAQRNKDYAKNPLLRSWRGVWKHPHSPRSPEGILGMGQAA